MPSTPKLNKAKSKEREISADAKTPKAALTKSSSSSGQAKVSVSRKRVKAAMGSTDADRSLEYGAEVRKQTLVCTRQQRMEAARRHSPSARAVLDARILTDERHLWPYFAGRLEPREVARVARAAQATRTCACRRHQPRRVQACAPIAVPCGLAMRAPRAVFPVCPCVRSLRVVHACSPCVQPLRAALACSPCVLSTRAVPACGPQTGVRATAGACAHTSAHARGWR